jgi:hypothetical protein
MSVPFLLIVASILLSFHIANHLDQILSALKNCRYITARSGLRHQGWFGRLALVAIIGGMVHWSGPGLRAGEMDATDLENFPEHLGRLLKIKHLITWVIGIWLLIVWAAIELR